MPEIEPRFPCPVCLGMPMDKARVGENGELVLDHCARCGGIWFELGEVQLLRRRDSSHLWERIPRRPSPAWTLCHSCHAPLDRAAVTCPACSAANAIDCPSCQQPLTTHMHEGLRLDVCEKCRGVWFDHAELTAIWALTLTTAARRSDGNAVAPRANDAGLIVLDALTFAPDLVFFGARAAGYAVSGTVDAIASSGVGDAVGDAASSVFEAILDILSGLF